MDCKTCNIPDVNCYEQCRDCFGASFDDCPNCPHIVTTEVVEERSEEGDDDA